MNTEQKENGLIINIPLETKTAIDAEFSTLSQTHLEKIYFLVWKINKEKSYQIHIGNHSEFFGLNRGQITSMISKLQNLMLIRCDGTYVEKRLSNSYTLIKNYSLRPTDHQVFYYASQRSIPMWVQKYVADGGTVRSTKHTNWKKAAPTKKETKDGKVQDLQQQLELAHAKIAELEATIHFQNEKIDEFLDAFPEKSIA